MIFLALICLSFVFSFPNSPHPRTLTETIAKAEQGDASAQYELGDRYKGGRDLPQSYHEAVKWYQKSADQGYAPAEAELGGMYMGGYGGLPKDDIEALKLYHMAADQGDGTAKFALTLHASPITAWARTLPQTLKGILIFSILGLFLIIVAAAFIVPIILLYRYLKKLFG